MFFLVEHFIHWAHYFLTLGDLFNCFGLSFLGGQFPYEFPDMLGSQPVD